jgi:hypothetical protein
LKKKLKSREPGRRSGAEEAISAEGEEGPGYKEKNSCVLPERSTPYQCLKTENNRQVKIA